MLLYKSEVRDSQIAGKGCFALENIPKGAVTGILAYHVDVMNEADYNAAQDAGDKHVIQTAMRWVGGVYLVNKPNDHKVEDKLNHSPAPNLLYHCGVLFALRDINAGEELTMDYKYVLSEGDVTAPTDIKTGLKSDGLPANEALLQSAKELVKLLS